MDIQTQKERNPPVRNIRRDSIETQTHTEQFTNRAGLKTEKESSIHSLHAGDTAESEKKPAAAGAEDMAEETEDSGTESGIARKTDFPVTSIDKKRRRAAKKKEPDSEPDDSSIAEDDENGGSGETRTNNTIPAQADSSTPENACEPENRDTIPIILENDSDESDSDNSGEVRTNNTIPAQANSSTPEDSHEPENRNAIPIIIDNDSDGSESDNYGEVRTNNTIPAKADNSTPEDSREPENRDTIPIIIDTDSGDSESNNSGEVRTNNTIPVQPDKSKPETEPEKTTPIADDDDSDSGEVKNNNPVPVRSDKPPDIPKKNEIPKHGILRKLPSDKLQFKKYNIAKTDSEGSQTIETAQAIESAGESVMQMGGTIRTAVSTSAEGIGKIHTMVKQGVRLGTARDVGRVAANIGSGIRTGAVNAVTDTGNQLLKTKIDKSTVTDTGTESMKQGLTELRYADNTRKAVQNTARGTIRTAAAIRNMPAETKAQVHRIRRNVQKARAVAKKSADVIRKVLTSKAGLIVIGTALAIVLIIMLANGLITVLVSAVTSLFSWMFPDGDSTDTVVQDNISSYISQIHAIQSEKQAEIDGIVNGLSPEYRYDGTVITGLNRYGNSLIEPYDDHAILAVLAVQKFHSIADASTTDFHFTDDEIREAVVQFYNFSYHYEYDYCPDRNCKFDSNCLLSLASGSFYISQINYDIASDTYAVTLNGTTYSQASRFFTRLEIYMADGGKITGSAYAGVSGGTWQIAYNIGGGGYRTIDWSNFYLNVDTTYCNNPNHCYLYSEVKNLSEEVVLNKAGFTEDEREIFEIYKTQILAMGG